MSFEQTSKATDQTKNPGDKTAANSALSYLSLVFDKDGFTNAKQGGPGSQHSQNASEHLPDLSLFDNATFRSEFSQLTKEFVSLVKQINQIDQLDATLEKETAAAKAGSDSPPPATKTSTTVDSAPPTSGTGAVETSSITPVDSPTAVPSGKSAPESPGIHTTVNGFFDANGTSLKLTGLNATPEDAVKGFANVKKDFPGLTAIRLNASPTNPEDPNIAEAIQAYTKAGIIVELEDHGTDSNGDVGAYSNWAEQYKNDPLLMLETPNEPKSDVTDDQTKVIEAIREQGFKNPIGIQPIGGYDQSNIANVLKNLQNDKVSTENMYVTPHIYYAGADPTAALKYARSEVDSAQKEGMPALIDEYGPSINGVKMDPEGETVNQAMLTLQRDGNGTQASVGSIYWGMDNGNHADGADSAYGTADGSKLTSDGVWLQKNTLA